MPQGARGFEVGNPQQTENPDRKGLKQNLACVSARVCSSGSRHLNYGFEVLGSQGRLGAERLRAVEWLVKYSCVHYTIFVFMSSTFLNSRVTIRGGGPGRGTDRGSARRRIAVRVCEVRGHGRRLARPHAVLPVGQRPDAPARPRLYRVHGALETGPAVRHGPAATATHSRPLGRTMPLAVPAGEKPAVSVSDQILILLPHFCRTSMGATISVAKPP